MTTTTAGEPAAPGGVDADPPPVAPLLKWPGGKTRELPEILHCSPPRIERYIEPFLGGGAVYFAMPASVPAYVNDSSPDLMALYRGVACGDPALFGVLEGIDAWWQSLQAVAEGLGDELAAAFDGLRAMPPDAAHAARGVADLLERHAAAISATVPSELDDLRDHFAAECAHSIPRKAARMRRVEVQRGFALPEADVWANFEGALKASCYTTLRWAYNRPHRRGSREGERAGLFLFLREYAYAAMFRFNAAGEFNVPYGGVSYNRKRFARKIAHLRSRAVVDRLRASVLACADFEAFLAGVAPRRGDFVFLDPPYDSGFREYDASTFGPADHERLAAVLDGLPCDFMLVIKATPLTRRLFAREGWHVRAIDKSYSWTIKQRNDRRAVHLLVTSYDPVDARRQA